MISTPRPEPSTLARHWCFDTATVHLNHGSFGACPLPVLDAQRRYRDQMEADGVRFFVDELWPLIDSARDVLAGVLECSPADLVLVPNATWAVATVLGSIRFEPGDEILSSPHEYAACRAMLDRVSASTGARVVEVDLPFPVTNADDITTRYLAAVTDRTRLCLLSLVTSPTAVIMPAADIVRGLHERGVDTLLDAAHGPGFVPLHLDDINAAYTTSNCHKWLCAPKGSAYLHVRRDKQPSVRPLALSVHTSPLERWASRLGRSAFQLEFDYVGTDDYSGRLAISDAVSFMSTVVPGGLDGVMRQNRDLCLKARDMLCNRLGLAPPVPDAMLGSMATLLLPAADSGTPPADPTQPDPLKQHLYDRHRVQVPIWSVPGPGGSRLRAVRLSAQVYNTPEQYEFLGNCLAEALVDQTG